MIRCKSKYFYQNCRLCRQNGHKQHQCTNVFAQDTENAPKPGSRQMSYDAPPNRREALPSQNAVQYNAGTLHKRIPEVLPQILKVQEGKVIVTERDLKSPRIEKKWVRKHENSEYHHKASLNRHVEALSNSNPKQSEFVNNHPRSAKQTTLMLPKSNESKTVFKSPGGGKSESYRQHFKTVHQKGSRDALTKECNSVTTDPLAGARVTQSRKPVLSRILPPDIEIKDIQKIISDMNEFGSRNLPPDKEKTLAYVVRWNSKQHPRQNLEEKEQRFLKLIKRISDRARRAKTERNSAESWSNDPKMRRHQEQRSSIGERKENQTASPTTSKTRSRRTSVSPGITQAINRTKGILKPELLLKFLMQVWGRKNILALASHFTTDLSALVTQLEQVVLIYYRGRDRGASEDRDIRWIEGLCSRLKGNSESSAQHFDTQHASKIQSLRTSLSPGIAKAISEVNGGVLEPELLTNFLVQVKGKRKLLEVAKHFTTDIGALVAQLEQVIDAYYCCSDQKDVAGEQDVRRIKGVCQRLLNGEGASAQQPASNFTNVHRSPSQVAMKTEPIPSRVFPPNPHVPHVFTKPEPTIIRMCIKTEPTEE